MPPAGVSAFAEKHGLSIEEPGSVRELTPALRTGARPDPLTGATGTNVPLAMTGDLGGFAGTLCHHTHTARGRKRESTIVLTAIPESLAFAPALAVRDREGLGSGDPEQ